MMRFAGLGLAVAVAAGLMSATAAEASPFGYGPPEREVLVERVAGGCGPGFYPNPWGHCRPNRWGWGGGWGGSRDDGYGGRPGYGYGGGRERGPGGYDGPRRPYGGY